MICNLGIFKVVDMVQDCKLLIHSAEQIVQVVNNGQHFLAGNGIDEKLVVLKNRNNGGLSLIVDSSGVIAFIGPDEEARIAYQDACFGRIIDASGRCILPGLVDSHTHPVWAGDRVHEFAMKISGASYMEIHEKGGGINFTVEHTRQASEDALYESLVERLDAMLNAGTTFAECKSGYGLNVESELKMLRVLERAKCNQPVDLSISFCGAHSIPKGMTSEEATNDVINRQLPAVLEAKESGEISCDNIDVFCEKGVFDTDQSKRILLAGKKHGLNVNFHGEELHNTKSAEMGADIGAMAISHLEEISEVGIKRMAESGCIAVILPTTAYILRLKHPPVRDLIRAGVPVALGSDFNPNAFCLSMPVVMHLACVLLRMTLAEALVGATINAAASLGKSDSCGSLEIGKQADILIVNADKWEHLIYQFGCHDRLIEYVIKRGDIVVDKIGQTT